MGNTVRLSQSIDDREVVAAFKRQAQLLDKIEKRLDATGKAGRGAGKETGTAFSNATKSVGRFVQAVAGVGSVVGAVALSVKVLRRELEQLRRRQGLAQETQLQVAGAQREALLNLGDDKTLSPAKLNQQITSISLATGAGQAALFKAFSGAVSFKGQNLQSKDALNAVRIAASITPESAEAIQTGAEAILAIKKAKPDASAAQIAGFLQRAKAAAPISSDALFSRNIAPAIAQLTQFGNTPQQAAALLTTLGQGIGDKEGTITATSGINFAKQLAEKLPNVKGGTIERLRFLQSPEGAQQRAKLLGPFEREAARSETTGLKSEAKAFTTLVSLLRGGDTASNQLLNKTLKSIPRVQDAEAGLKKSLDVINRQALQINAAAERLLNVGGESLSIIDISAGRAAISRKGLRSVLERSGASAGELDVENLFFELGTGFGEQAPLRSVSESLRTKSKTLGRPLERVFSPQFGVHGLELTKLQRREPTADEARTAQILTRIADGMDQLVKLTQSTGGTDRVERRLPGGKALKERPINVNVVNPPRQQSRPPAASALSRE